MWLWVGLGNPGTQYAKNRHNVGFLAVERIALRHNFSKWRKAFNGQICEGTIDGEKVLLLKPETFMNNSGLSISQALQYYKMSPNNLFVFHDEMDLPNAKARIKHGGGHAGNNGIRSTITHIGADFARFRIGVGRSEHSSESANYVLNDFSKAQWNAIDELLDQIAKYSPLLVKGQESQIQSALALAMDNYYKQTGEE